MDDSRDDKPECLLGALRGIQVPTLVFREIWDTIFTDRRVVFVRRSRGIMRTIVGAFFGIGGGLAYEDLATAFFPGKIVLALGEQGEIVPKKLDTSLIEAIRKDALESFEFPNPSFPDYKEGHTFFGLGPTRICLGGKSRKFHFMKIELKVFHKLREEVTASARVDRL